MLLGDVFEIVLNVWHGIRYIRQFYPMLFLIVWIYCFCTFFYSSMCSTYKGLIMPYDNSLLHRSVLSVRLSLWPVCIRSFTVLWIHKYCLHHYVDFTKLLYTFLLCFPWYNEWTICLISFSRFSESVPGLLLCKKYW